MDKKSTDTQEEIQEIEQAEETSQPVTEDEHASCQEQLASTESAYKRALADYQNLEKRVRDERSELMKFANRELLLRFLAIFDTLILAQQHENNDTFRVVIAQFSDTLKAEGLVKIEVVGKKFDPQLMEVVTTGEGKEGIVIQEVRSGYLLHDKLLRPAQVIVGNGEKEN